MNPSDLKTAADVATWLKHHVEWRDEASRDMMLRAVKILSTLPIETDDDLGEAEMGMLREQARCRG